MRALRGRRKRSFIDLSLKQSFVVPGHPYNGTEKSYNMLPASREKKNLWSMDICENESVVS